MLVLGGTPGEGISEETWLHPNLSTSLRTSLGVIPHHSTTKEGKQNRSEPPSRVGGEPLEGGFRVGTG